MTNDARHGASERPEDEAGEKSGQEAQGGERRGGSPSRGGPPREGGKRGEGERRARGAPDRRRDDRRDRDPTRGAARGGRSRDAEERERRQQGRTGSAPRDDAARRSRDGSRGDARAAPGRGGERRAPAASEDKPKREPGPELPPHITPLDLDPDVRQELVTLPRTLADHIAKHLVLIGTVMDEDPERAYAHGVYVRKKASRIGVVREASGLAAYRLGRWQEALSDLRAARRMSGRDHLLAVIADCERGLGRPERALEMIHGADQAERAVEERVELRIVAAGARRDLGEAAAALVELNMPELQERRARPWAARLFYAYADTLLVLGREEEAREYFAKSSAVDTEGETDADERLAALEGLQIVDHDGDITWTDAEAPFEEPRAEGGQEGEGSATRD